MTIRIPSMLALLVALPVVGCQQDGEPVPTVRESVERMATESEPPAKPDEPTVPEGIRRIDMEVGEGDQAATVRVWVHPEGDGTCAQAYNTSMAWVQGMQRLWGGVEAYPDRDEFMNVCADLPEEVKRCMLIDYAIQNRRSCEQARDDLAPALAERLRAVSPVAEE